MARPPAIIAREKLAELIEALSGVDVEWVGDPNAQMGAGGRDQAWIDLAVTTITPKGNGEYRTKTNAVNPLALSAQIVTYVKFVVTMKARSYDPSLQPYDLLEAVRQKLAGSVTAAAFYDDTNTAFVEAHPTQITQGSTGGKRVRLDAVMDVVFATIAGGDPGDDDGLTIGHVNSDGPVPLTGR